MSIRMRYCVSWYVGGVFCSRAFSNLTDAVVCFRMNHRCLFVDSLSFTCID